MALGHLFTDMKLLRALYTDLGMHPGIQLMLDRADLGLPLPLEQLFSPDQKLIKLTILFLEQTTNCISQFKATQMKTP
jgi:hypothetical protein